MPAELLAEDAQLHLGLAGTEYRDPNRFPGLHERRRRQHYWRGIQNCACCETHIHEGQGTQQWQELLLPANPGMLWKSARSGAKNRSNPSEFKLWNGDMSQ